MTDLPGRVSSGDDHPRNARHVECEVVHGPAEYAIPRHCRCGLRWPCPMTPPARTATAEKGS